MTRRGGVKRAIAISGSAQRVLLLAWAADDTPRLRNIVGMDAAGDVIWRADLPGHAPRDCFVHVEREGPALRAHTFSGLNVLLDPLTGVPLVEEPLAA